MGTYKKKTNEIITTLETVIEALVFGFLSNWHLKKLSNSCFIIYFLRFRYNSTRV